MHKDVLEKWLGLTRSFRALAVFVCVAVIALPAFAAQYTGQPFTYQQPDGSEITVYVYGDEFLAYGETEDGYIVQKDPKSGFFCYAKIKPDGSEIISTGVRVGRAKPPGLQPKLRLPRAVANAKHKSRRELLGFDDRGRLLSREEVEEELMQRAASDEEGTKTEGDNPPIVMAPPSAPTINKRVSLVVLASFPDRPGDVTIPQSEVDDFSNATGYTGNGNATSIRGYFLEQSNNKFDYSSVVTAWFVAANNRDYYTTDSGQGFGPQARELITEGLQALKDDGFDFTLCDGDGDGDVDGINCFYAGSVVNAWADNFGLWPHSSGSTWGPLSGVPGLTSAYSKYQITAIGSGLVIGTWIHENGHMICNYPDLYSYNGNAANLGNYSLMASGNYAGGQKHPTSIDPYLKFHAGWMDLIELDNTSHQRCVVQVDGNQTYRYQKPGDSLEYFLFEVRDNTGYEGPYGGHLSSVNPDTGLLAWHCKQNGSSTYSTIFTADNPADYTTPFEAFVVEANPSTGATPWYKDPTPNGNDAFKSSGVSTASDATTPALKFWDATGRNTSDGVDVHSISADGPVMTFVIGSGAPSGGASVELSRSTIDTFCNFGGTAGAETFYVINSQSGTLNYNVSDNAAWLSCDVVSGSATTEADLVNVTFSTSGLSAGSYTGTITVDDGGASSKTITVNLTVHPQPTMELGSTNIQVFGFAGMSGAQGSFTIRNIGGGEMSYSVSSTQTWSTPSPSSGSVIGEVDTIYANCDATSLSAGTYYDTVTITSAEANNSPLTLDVEFIVQSTDMIVTYPDGGETLSGNSTETITWSSSLGGNVQIDLYKGGSVDQTLAATTPNDGSFDWAVPFGMYGTNYQIRITSIEQPSKDDYSNGDFTIATCYSFESDLDGWIQETGDDLDWTRQTGTTPSRGSNTGPPGASDGSYYLFTESSSPNYSKTANIYKDLDFSTLNEPLVMFDYHMYGAAMGSLYFEVSTNSGSSWSTEWSLSGDQGDVWVTTNVDLTAYANMASVRLRFRGFTGTSFTSDMSFDRVCIIENSSDGIRFSSSVLVGESSGVATVTVDRVGSTVGAISVDYATSDGTATNGADYTAASGTLNWADGNGDSKTFTVPILDNSTKETYAETVTLTLSNPSGTLITGANPSTLTILDDDNQAPTVYAGSDQIVVLTGGTWSPTDVGVDLWLDADDAASVQLNGSTVSNWVDKSGNGRDATQTTAGPQPTYTAAGLNGKSVVTFDGSIDYLKVDLDFLATVDHSSFIVTKPVVYSDIYGALNPSASSNSLHVGFTSASNYRMNFWGNDYTPTLTANFHAGAGNLLNYIWTTGAAKQILANGSLEGSGGTAGAIGSMSGGGQIGRVVNHPYYGGDIAEIIMKTGTVTQEERELFEGYLAHKWGIESYLPGGHPYATNSPSGAEATANLSGSASDGDDDPLTLTWTMASGPAPVSFDDDSITNAVATFSKEGVYTLRLTVTDGIDETNDTCVITVITGGVSVVVSESGGSTDVTEGGATDNYSLSLLIAPTNDVVVDLSTNGQVSVSPSSFTFTTVNWMNAQTVTVTAVDDSFDEGLHTGLVTHAVSSADTDYDGLTVTDVVPNITDNDDPGVIGLQQSSYSVSEDGNIVTVYVTRTGGDASAVSVDITTVDVTAIAGTDYTTNSTTLNWSDRDSATKPFAVNIIDNGAYAGDRDFSVQLSNITGGASLGTTSATVTIQEDEPEPIGARVISQSPAADASQSPGVTQVTMTFSEAIDTNSFSLAEDIIAFTGAQGTNLLSTITGYSWAGGDTELTITFNALTEGASHRLVIGPDILTTNAFPMDQDDDSALGEYPEDTYAANIWIVAGGTNITLWSDLLDTDDTPDPGWTLGSGWAIGTPVEVPPAGPDADTDAGTMIVAQNLSGNYVSGVSSYSETPDIDASTFTSVSLDFQEWKGAGKNDILYVEVGYGATWQNVYSYTGPNGGANDSSWGPRQIDLTTQATGQVFRIRWGLTEVTTGGSGVQTGWQLDAIRVSGDSIAGGDPALPLVVSHAPTGTVEGLVSSLYLSFSQPMDTNSFAIVDDVASFNGPTGAVTVTDSVWVSSSLLRIEFSEQVVSGTYTLVLDPTILDTWGQAIDQDKDGTGNEALQDQYTASFVLDNANYIIPPSGLNASAASSSQVDLSWLDNSDNETGFALERSISSGSGFSTVATPTANATNYADTTITPGISYYYRISATNASNSSEVSTEASVAVPKALATVWLSDLSQTYDGSAKPVTVITSPTGLTVNVTYDGGAAPSNAGSYAVSAIINDATYQGSTNGTLVISKATASVTLTGLSQAYDGTARTVGATTAPVGLTVDRTYDGSSTPPVNAGSYAVTGTVNEVNYQGQDTGTLVVSKLTPTVTNWPTASDIMEGQALSDSTLTGGGATVSGSFSFDVPGTTPGIGTHTADVTFTPTDSTNYEPVGGTVDVGVKAAATVTLSNLSQTYDGGAKAVSVSTVPTGLVVVVTYEGSAIVPTNAGNYAVVATVDEADYIGSTNGTLVVSKATPTVTEWPTAADIYVGQAVSNATLSGGSASVAGVVSYDAPATTPSVGTYSAAVTFTPADTNNYNTVSDSIDVTVLPLAPAAPTGLSASPSVGQVDLSWVASSNATSYNVKRSSTAGGPYSTVDSPVSTNSTDSVANGATYYYVVSAVNAGGESPNSAEVSAKLLHVVPFSEDFESLALGDLNGKNGWSSTNAVVQTNTALDVQAGSITSEVGFVEQEFAGASSNVWTDFEIQPVFCPDPPSEITADITTMLYFNTNGNPVVYNGTNAQVLSSIMVTNGAWVRVTINSDYDLKQWSLYIDNAPAASGLGFYNAAVTRYERFKVSGAGPAGAAIDDVSIDVNSPFGNLLSLTVNSLYGSPSPSGTSSYISNAVVNAWLSGSPITMGATQYVCTGWSGTGSAPVSGSGTNTSFTITEDTTLTWQWSTNYYIDFQTIGE